MIETSIHGLYVDPVLAIAMKKCSGQRKKATRPEIEQKIDPSGDMQARRHFAKHYNRYNIAIR